MKKIVLTLGFAAVVTGFIACGNDAPKTDLNEQEQAAVDSTVITDEAASDSLEAAIRAQIGNDVDSASEESHEDHGH